MDELQRRFNLTLEILLADRFDFKIVRQIFIRVSISRLRFFSLIGKENRLIVPARKDVSISRLRFFSLIATENWRPE